MSSRYLLMGLLSSVLAVAAPGDAGAQILEAPCDYYCRHSDPHESGAYQCDNLEITQAPCKGRWIFGIACATGCVEEEQLASAPTTIGPNGSLVESAEYVAILASNPGWAEVVEGSQDRILVRSSCNGTVLARLYSSPPERVVISLDP